MIIFVYYFVIFCTTTNQSDTVCISLLLCYNNNIVTPRHKYFFLFTCLGFSYLFILGFYCCHFKSQFNFKTHLKYKNFSLVPFYILRVKRSPREVEPPQTCLLEKCITRNRCQTKFKCTFFVVI